MSFSTALVYDVIFLVVFSFAAVKSWQKGFLAGLTELVGAVLGVGIAVWGSRTLAPEVYSRFFSGAVSEQVNQAVAQSGGDMAALVQALDFLPDFLRDAAANALLVRLLRGVNAIPLLGGANRMLGLALGLVTGALDCWLLALALWFVASITTGQLDWLNAATLQRSIGYSFFSAFNPFLVHY